MSSKVKKNKHSRQKGLRKYENLSFIQNIVYSTYINFSTMDSATAVMLKDIYWPKELKTQGLHSSKDIKKNHKIPFLKHLGLLALDLTIPTKPTPVSSLKTYTSIHFNRTVKITSSSNLPKHKIYSSYSA